MRKGVPVNLDSFSRQIGEDSSAGALLLEIRNEIIALKERQELTEAFHLELANAVGGLFGEIQKHATTLEKDVVPFVRDIAHIQGILTESHKNLLGVCEKHFNSPAPAVDPAVRGQLHAIKALGQLTYRKLAPVAGRIRCVFLVHSVDTWDALAGICEAMQSDDRFEPLVVTINRNYPGEQGFGGEDATSRALTKAGVKHLRLGMQDSFEGLAILQALMPDVIFRQSQWERDVPPAFRVSEMSFAKICFVPYASSIVAHVSKDTSAGTMALGYDEPFQRVAWRIFVDVKRNKDIVESYQHVDPSRVIISGNPKYDTLLKAVGSDQWPIESKGDRKAFRVVWAPHHSLGNMWLAFGVFHKIYKQMLYWAMARPDIEFVMKPHPALYGIATSEGHISKFELDNFFTQWSALENCSICHGQYAELFASSDLLITDGVSFLLEYQLFNKPLVFFDSGRHVPLNDLGKLAEAAAHVVTDFAEMQTAVDEYRNGKPWEREEERRALLEAMIPAGRSPTKRILDEIADGIIEGASLS